ncbi:MAG TPA: hypothetical protein VEL68_05035 [Thermodesulfobacteriota bacterium]|nr:hypothetical protein [Thermodesulfobacteriota bacterium]
MGLVVFSLAFITMLIISALWNPEGRADDPGVSIPKTIIELQPFRQTNSIQIKSAQGREGLATLININPGVNAWFLLNLDFHEGTPAEEYHLQNTNPETQKLSLDADYPYGLVVEEGVNRYTCNLWGVEPRTVLKRARASGAAYAPLCEGRLYLRNPAKGHRTRIEMATDFLRDEVPGGEKIVTIVRDTFFADAYREKTKTAETPKTYAKELSPGKPGTVPASALLDQKEAGRIVVSTHLGIEVLESPPHEIVLGNWYEAKDNPGIFISLIAANRIAPEILRSYPKRVANLDRLEAEALVYMIAFDLDRFNLGFALGTEHPRVDWSDHAREQMKDPSLPGPDGIGNIVPLVSTGLINPKDAGRTVAAFTGGFKRAHGAFRSGDLALKNHGSHYGFMENGVIFSKLQPGLATIYVLNDRRVDMKTWEDEDNRLLPSIRYARQNGVPIITDFDPASQMSVPGPLVSRWGEGNWSGSEDNKLRTMRAGAALQERGEKRFFLYAVFTSATPSAMARVFQGYGARYAMLLDMNALEHTYLSVYRRQGSRLYVQHLIQGMSEVDKSSKGEYIPRFLGFPDNRDFFYFLQKEAP